MTKHLIIYAVMGRQCSREEALEYWRLECQRSNMDIRVAYFAQAETPDERGGRYRMLCNLLSDLLITVTHEE